MGCHSAQTNSLFLVQVSQVCISCGVNMGEYFCDVCKFYDDDVGLIFVYYGYALSVVPVS
jgi:hypothetical protein